MSAAKKSLADEENSNAGVDEDASKCCCCCCCCWRLGFVSLSSTFGAFEMIPPRPGQDPVAALPISHPGVTQGCASQRQNRSYKPCLGPLQKANALGISQFSNINRPLLFHPGVMFGRFSQASGLPPREALDLSGGSVARERHRPRNTSRVPLIWAVMTKCGVPLRGCVPLLQCSPSAVRQPRGVAGELCFGT